MYKKTEIIEYSDGYWEKREYDANGNVTRLEDSDGCWEKYEYDANGNVTSIDSGRRDN